jgi:hypothetical protein
MAKASAQPARVTIAIGNEPLFIERTVRAISKVATKDDPQAQRFDIATPDKANAFYVARQWFALAEIRPQYL